MPDFHPSEADDQVFPELFTPEKIAARKRAEQELHGATLLEDEPGRTSRAQKTLEIAFLLLCFAKAGAPVEPMLLGWARGTLWRNGEVCPL